MISLCCTVLKCLNSKIVSNIVTMFGLPGISYWILILVSWNTIHSIISCFGHCLLTVKFSTVIEYCLTALIFHCQLKFVSQSNTAQSNFTNLATKRNNFHKFIVANWTHKIRKNRKEKKKRFNLTDLFWLPDFCLCTVCSTSKVGSATNRGCNTNVRFGNTVWFANTVWFTNTVWFCDTERSANTSDWFANAVWFTTANWETAERLSWNLKKKL